MPSLETKAAADKKVPILWSHDWMTVPIGYCARCFEDPEGLVVEGQLLMGDERAQSVHTLMKQRAVTEFSFGFEAESFTFQKEADQVVRELSRVDLIEVSPVLFPANDSTELLSTKIAALERKAGATLSARSRTRLESVRAALLTAAEELSGFLEDPTSGEKHRPGGDDPPRLALAWDDPHEADRRLIAEFWPR